VRLAKLVLLLLFPTWVPTVIRLETLALAAQAVADMELL
jgi:hypothetical protein